MEKKDSFWSKRGSDSLMNQLVFIIIVIAFAAIMILFVTRYGNRAPIKEEIYAKQIALAIDKASAGTSIVIDVSEVYKDARKNNVNKVIEIDNANKNVIIHVSAGKGYSYGFFSTNFILWNVDDTKGEEKLTVKIE